MRKTYKYKTTEPNKAVTFAGAIAQRARRKTSVDTFTGEYSEWLDHVEQLEKTGLIIQSSEIIRKFVDETPTKEYIERLDGKTNDIYFETHNGDRWQLFGATDDGILANRLYFKGGELWSAPMSILPFEKVSAFIPYETIQD